MLKKIYEHGIFTKGIICKTCGEEACYLVGKTTVPYLSRKGWHLLYPLFQCEHCWSYGYVRTNIEQFTKQHQLLYLHILLLKKLDKQKRGGFSG